ncbi:MAG: HEPN domain-containing protein [Fidelibacterota bacterium]
MAERSQDWLKQARRDFESATGSFEGGFYEWACFIYQQSAEKALKAVYQAHNADARGHSIVGLMRGLKNNLGMNEIDDELEKQARHLDRYYIASRYPNGWPSGYPGEMITKDDAEIAKSSSQAILSFCEQKVL